MPDDGTPLPSLAEEEAEEEDDTEEPTTTPSTAPARPPVPEFKFSTFILVFLFMLGIIMLFDTSARNQIATLLGTSASQTGFLYDAIGFSSQHLLATMALVGAVEMLMTALAYNWTTDWIKAAKVQAWSAAFRKVQMNAFRSGKKDRIEALKPHQSRLTTLSSEVSIAQLKGMAVTWFLLIVIYSWVGLVIGAAAVPPGPYVDLGGAMVGLQGKIFNLIPVWFLLFSVYTVPFSMLFRRLLKHYWLRRYERNHPGPAAPTEALAGDTA